jgi:hypothetical protein
VFTDGLTTVETRAGSWDEEGQLASMKENFKMYEEMWNQILVLSNTMIHCIQKMNIGNLLGQQVPIPESGIKSEKEQSPQKKTLLEAQ